MLLFFKKVDLINDKIIQFFKYFASLLLVIVGLLIFADVLLRGAFNKPLIGVPEIIANLVVIIAFFQFAYAENFLIFLVASWDLYFLYC